MTIRNLKSLISLLMTIALLMSINVAFAEDDQVEPTIWYNISNADALFKETFGEDVDFFVSVHTSSTGKAWLQMNLVTENISHATGLRLYSLAYTIENFFERYGVQITPSASFEAVLDSTPTEIYDTHSIVGEEYRTFRIDKNYNENFLIEEQALLKFLKYCRETPSI